MTAGYWRAPDATAETLRGGWLHTGDIGRLDERGFLHVLDRLKDMIITGGSNVYAREVEDVLLRHPAVRDAALFGIPDRLWGEAVTAVVVGPPWDVIRAMSRGTLSQPDAPPIVTGTAVRPPGRRGRPGGL